MRKKIPLKIIWQVLERSNFRCVICECNNSLEIDHVFPYSKGGSNKIDNLQVLCAPCNSKKRADEYYIDKLILRKIFMPQVFIMSEDQFNSSKELAVESGYDRDSYGTYEDYLNDFSNIKKDRSKDLLNAIFKIGANFKA